MKKHITMIICIITQSLVVNFGYSQKPVAMDSLKKAEIEQHSPSRATIYSAILPGLGQVYNKKYWKVPIIYGGFGALTYSYLFSDGKYSNYLNEYTHRIEKDSSLFNTAMLDYTDDNILELKNYYQRNRELSIIGMVILYALNVIDATVDGHLYSFDISDNLSMNINPYFSPNYDNRYNGGVQLSFSPKRTKNRPLKFKNLANGVVN
jgi:hypothetical protein